MYPIPANATRIRYLESTGTQYIDTGIAVSDPSTIAIEADEDVTQPLGFTHQNVVSGTWVSRFSPPEATGNLHIYYKDFNKRVVTSANETRKTARWCGSSGYYENGASLTSFVASVGSDSIAGRNWLYGAVWDFNVNAVDFRFGRAGKIYGLKVEVSGQLVRDFVPVRVGRVGYLFDRVTGQLFGNSGTGSFVLGPDTFQQGVVPTRMMAMGVRKRPYDAEVEYLESTGTQYIDTGIDAAVDADMSIDAVSLNTGSTQFHAMGVFSTSSNSGYALFCSSTGMITGSVGSDIRVRANGVNWNTRRLVELKKGELIIDGTSYGLPSPMPTSLLPGNHIWLMGLNGVDITLPSHPGKLYGAKISVGSALVRDFQPVRKNGVGYLFDRANPTGGPLGNGLYGSATSTPLIAGPDKIPS